MKNTGLTSEEMAKLRSIFCRHESVDKVVLFGSRAKGTAHAGSDIDLAVHGITEDLQIESLALELDELPLPYKIDVKSFSAIKNPALREHVERVGVTIYEKQGI